MTTVTEGRQRLELDDSWRVLKWDAADEYVHGMQRALHQLGGGLSAADVVATRRMPRQRTLMVVELKDFEHPRIPDHEREQNALDAVSDTLMRDIVRKVVDTLAGATFAHDGKQRRCPALDDWRPAIGLATTRILILLCIEVPASQAVAALAWTKQLQRRLRWLGPHARVVVTNSARPFAGIGVAYRV